MDVLHLSPTELNQDIFRFSNNPVEQLQLFGALMNQRAKMIQEINSFVDGSSVANPMMMMDNPALNPLMNPTVMQAPIQNPHMMTFNPLVTEDYKIAKVMEINNRLLEW